ncbi:hypothetical protein [Euzebya pacifica]|uniref:hypothetical protein n=1 Tax=Euzebya pacifica TaxID=1608957 RepID=UPI0030FBFECF
MVLGDLIGIVDDDELGTVIGRVDLSVQEPTGTVLRGPSDRRWAFKAAQGDLLSAECRAATCRALATQ